ncbi:helix-turn-helix domain-containing protein [Tateyamaria armeniaca]|uniref:Helix-turn-helix domain-containing protein n=1 Tax=Tateyamaria armeniaca TaxID=2518930 RepID=A0ABW8UQY4_9RHOB
MRHRANMAPNIDRSFDRSLAQFAARKSKVAMSNAELSRRTGLSVNTIKTYMSGGSVRESTVQRLHEALDVYTSERQAIAEGKDTPRFEPSASQGKDADSLEAATLLHIELATNSFREAVKQRRRAGSKVADAVREEIEMEIRLLQELLK